MKDLDDIEIDDLKKQYRENPLFRSLMDFLVDQEKDERQLSVEGLRGTMEGAGISVSYRDVVRMMQSLQAGGCGSFIIGRKGWPSRFQFNVSMTELAKAVTGKGSEIVPMKPAPKMINHKFRLRPELEIALELPEDLADKEVARIGDFLKTLPFEHAGSSEAA